MGGENIGQLDSFVIRTWTSVLTNHRPGLMVFIPGLVVCRQQIEGAMNVADVTIGNMKILGRCRQGAVTEQAGNGDQVHSRLQQVRCKGVS